MVPYIATVYSLATPSLKKLQKGKDQHRREKQQNPLALELKSDKCIITKETRRIILRMSTKYEKNTNTFK
jgi:hypothetical protein